MARVLRSPGKYVQGPGCLPEMKEHLRELGSRVFFLATPGGVGRFGAAVEDSLRDSGLFCTFETMSGECCKREIDRLSGLLKASDCDMVAGIGGGKVLDTAKAIAYYNSIPLAIIPTVASSDAPCSALSVLYREDGEFDQYLFLKQSPQLVLVDSQVIAEAPVRLLVAGMGDALATYFEARAVMRAGRNNQVGGTPTLSAQRLAAMCYETLLADGIHAKAAVERRCCTTAVENVIEVNTYLSGVGFESGGLGAAHAYQKGFTTIPKLHELYHGEIVAFGTIAQLVLENAPEQELARVVRFCAQVGLPVCFADLGVPDITGDELRHAAAFATRPGMTIHNMPFAITPEASYAAFVAADAMGRLYGEKS